MTVSVGVGEETALEHFVEGRLDSGDEMSWTESGLLDLLEVVLGITVENHLSEVDARVVSVGPDFGDIEDVPPKWVKNLATCI